VLDNKLIDIIYGKFVKTNNKKKKKKAEDEAREKKMEPEK